MLLSWISGFGMVDHHWTEEAIAIFDPVRAMFASNFSVDKAKGRFDWDYETLKSIDRDLLLSDRHELFHDQVQRVYRLQAGL